MLFIRSLFFYIFFISSIVLVSLLINILYLFASTKTLQNICKYWITLNNKVLSFFCNINYEVSGYKHIPNEPCIVIANHQGPWESLFVQTLKIPSSSIIKKNLTLIVPGFLLKVLFIQNFPELWHTGTIGAPEIIPTLAKLALNLEGP